MEDGKPIPPFPPQSVWHLQIMRDFGRSVQVAQSKGQAGMSLQENVAGAVDTLQAGEA